MIPIAGNEQKIQLVKEKFQQYEYEVILFVFLLLRFIFKNLMGLGKYFTAQPVFGLSSTMCIILGAAVVLTVCVCLACFFGQLIRKNGSDFEKSIFILVALFFACPSTFPFLFDTGKLSGTQMLYPFTLFIFAVCLIGKPVVEWLVPVICMIYFIPALYTSAFFFTALQKGAILYVPLILLLLFLDMMKNTDSRLKKKNQDKEPETLAKNQLSVINPAMFVCGLLVSISSYIYFLMKGNIHFGENVYGSAQKIDIYLLVCLLITAPLLFAVRTILYYGLKNKFLKSIFNVYLCFIILLFPLFWNNYYGLWVPFLTISLPMFVFFAVWQKNPAILFAINALSEFFLKRRLLFLFFLIAMASLSNISTYYSSDFILKVFHYIPF